MWNRSLDAAFMVPMAVQLGFGVLFATFMPGVVYRVGSTEFPRRERALDDDGDDDDQDAKRMTMTASVGGDFAVGRGPGPEVGSRAAGVRRGRLPGH